MKILLLGSAGMLGSAIYVEGKHRGLEILGVDVVDAQIILDISNANELTRLIEQEKPDVIINTVAITSLDACEKDPGLAYMINARPVAIIASLCKGWAFTLYIFLLITFYWRRTRNITNLPR